MSQPTRTTEEDLKASGWKNQRVYWSDGQESDCWGHPEVRDGWPWHTFEEAARAEETRRKAGGG